MRLFEILRNAIQPAQWVRDFAGRYSADFEVASEEFYVQVDIIQGPRKYASVIFGKYDEMGRGSTTLQKTKKPVLVFNTVITAVKKLLSQLKIDVVVFAAKAKDGAFESRTSLYTKMAQRFKIETNWNLETRIKGELGVFILSKEHLDKEDMKYVRDALGIKKK